MPKKVKLKLWLDTGYVGGKIEDTAVLEFPDDATQIQIDAECGSYYEVWQSNQIHGGWQIQEEGEDE